MEEKKREVQDLRDKIRDTIFEVLSSDEEEMRLADLRRRMLISYLFTLPLLILALTTSRYVWSLPVQGLLILPVIFVNLQGYRDGLTAFRSKRPEKNLLAILGSMLALAFLQIAAAGVILSILATCRCFEAYITCKLDAHLKELIAAMPTATTLQEGDVASVLAGDVFPVDGVILSGNSAVDEELITGEKIPPEKGPADLVYAGTKNLSSGLSVQVIRTGEDTILSKLIDHLSNAITTKAPLADRAEKAGRIFVGLVILIAVLAAGVCLYLGHSRLDAVLTVVSVLVIANPYAFSASIPLTVIAGTIRGAQDGILIKSAGILEQTRDINTFVMNKTGTITEGEPEISDILPISEGFSLRIAGALESRADHPVGKAIYRAACETFDEIPQPEALAYVPGRGVSGIIDGRRYYGGNAAYMSQLGISTHLQQVESLLRQSKSIVYFASEGQAIGVVALRDEPKPVSMKAITQIEGLGIDVVMLTGDSRQTAAAVKEEVGIDHVYAEILPGEKGAVVESIRRGRDHLVAMVGDGITDADAIARADMGIAIGSGRDINIGPADIILITDDLMDVVRAIRLSRHANRSIRQIIGFAYCYNIVALLFAAGILVPLAGQILAPMIASTCMCVSQLAVILSTLRLKNARL